jgi:hypothetical protein
MRSEDGYLFTPSPEEVDEPDPRPVPDPEPVVPGPRQPDPPPAAKKGTVKKVLTWTAAGLAGLIGIGLLLPEEPVDGVEEDAAFFEDVAAYGGGMEDVLADGTWEQDVESWLMEYGSDPNLFAVSGDVYGLADGESISVMIALPDGRHGEAVGLCDSDCGGLGLQLFYADGTTPVAYGDWETQSVGPEPTVQIPPLEGEPYLLQVTALDCAAPACEVAVGVFGHYDTDLNYDLGSGF